MIFGLLLVECITQCFTMFERVAAIVEAALGMQRSLLLVCCMTWWGSFQAGKGGELTHDETTIIAGALELTEKTASQAMTAIESVFSLDVTAKLDLYVRFSCNCKNQLKQRIVCSSDNLENSACVFSSHHQAPSILSCTTLIVGKEWNFVEYFLDYFLLHLYLFPTLRHNSHHGVLDILHSVQSEEWTTWFSYLILWHCSETMNIIMAKGHSRVPVYIGEPTNIVGLLLVIRARSP
jgi:hypothetical protein